MRVVGLCSWNLNWEMSVIDCVAATWRIQDEYISQYIGEK